MERTGFWAAMPLVRNIALVAVRRGADLNGLCEAIGVTKEMLENPDALANLDQSIKAWELALRYTRDPNLGLHLGETTSPGLVGMVGYLMESSPDLLTAFEHLVEFKRLVDSEPTWLEVRDEKFIFHLAPDPLWMELSPETARQVVDHSFSAIPNFIKLLCGKPVYPIRVHAPFSRPNDTSEYLRILKTEPMFRQPEACMVFRLKDLQMPLIGHNPSLNAVFKELLEKNIARMGAVETFSGQVRKVILQKFISVIPQLQDVADRMGVTPRTLQRRLKEEGTTFQHIVEGVKSEMACGLLKKPELTVSEIAYKLGYMEPNVFRRAFKKWTGMSPKAYVRGENN